MSIDLDVRKWANVFLKLDRMVEGSPNTKTASNKIRRVLEASTLDARSVAGWYSAYQSGRVSLEEAATALHREGATLPAQQRTAARKTTLSVNETSLWTGVVVLARQPFIEASLDVLSEIFRKNGATRARVVPGFGPGLSHLFSKIDGDTTEIRLFWASDVLSHIITMYITSPLIPESRVQLKIHSESPTTLARKIWGHYKKIARTTSAK